MVKDDLVRYQYSERLKSELIIGMKLVRSLETIDDKDFKGATRILSEFFSALSVEVGIAYNSTGDERFKEVNEIISDLDFIDIDNAIEKLGRAMTLITNCAVDSYSKLQQEGIF